MDENKNKDCFTVGKDGGKQQKLFLYRLNLTFVLCARDVNNIPE